MKLYVIHILLIFLFITSCIEPYQINTEGEGKFLVVDGLVTNREGPYSVLLNYSTPTYTPKFENVANAEVKIVEDLDEVYVLNYVDNGKYQTDPNFRAIIGKSYKLQIDIDTKHYESDLCLLREPSCIDNISMQKKTKFGGGYGDDVLQLLVDANVCSEDETCLRWDVKEDWKIHLRNPEFFYMVNDSTFGWTKDVITDCYKSDKIDRIVIQSFQNQAVRSLVAKGVASVSPYISDRFLTRYRATINQYSISKQEYHFWDMLRSSTENSEDFFGRQPYSVYGNISCITNPDENVLGYFQVAGVTSKEIYVDRGDISRLGLGVYSYRPCAVDTILVSDEYSLYEEYIKKIRSNEWIYSQNYYTETAKPVLLGITFLSAECGKCSKNNARVEPPLGWVDND
ncbi:DUF4249 domain-containing protein [Labilibacter marinus]|uniref:DUF4249 domain-containing protein n=1 Tax=Labilibacter marinus TaxID=1477105 RepID=UPI00094F93CE|nr:DUF4249 domain-containing protein [Labilibacter marinus]